MPNVKIGACNVSFKGVDLGHSIGECTVNYSPDWYDMKVNKYGTTVVDKYLKGESFTVKVPLAESTIANLIVGAPAMTNGTTKATIGKDAGTRASTLAGLLVLHPQNNDSDDLSEDVVMHKAISVNELPISFSNEGERIIEVTFQALVDETKTDGNRLGLIGDSTT